MNNDMKKARSLLASNRLFLYTLLQRAFAAGPDDEFVEQLLDEHTRAEVLLLDSSREDEGEYFDILAAIESEKRAMVYCREYEKLIIGPDKPLVPPWESVYVSGEPLLFQGSTLAVRQMYRKAGFRAAGYPHEADDHVATELSFIAKLAGQTVEALDANDGCRARGLLETQRDFLNDHLLAWAGAFSERLQLAALDHGISCFYPAFARLAVRVCERDDEVIEELLAIM